MIGSSFWLVLFFACCLPVLSQAEQPSAPDQQQDTSASEEYLTALSKAHPADAKPLAQLGLLEARRGKYPEAIAFYRRAMKLSPALPGLSLNLGLAYFKDGQYKEALRIFTPMQGLHSQSPAEMQRLTVLLGMSYYGMGDYQAAAPYLQKSVSRDPQNLSLLLTLAHSCLLAKKYQCVLDTYHAMVSQNAESAEADMLVGEALDEMLDTEGATREFRAAVAANPKEPNAHFALGYLLWKQLQYPEAAKEFQAELDNFPDFPQAALYLADTYIHLHRMEEASRLLEKLVKNEPRLAKARLDLGIVYAADNRSDDALLEFRQAAALKPDDVNVHMRLGRLYKSMGRATEAKNEFDKAGRLIQVENGGVLGVISGSDEKVSHAAAKHSAQ